MAWGKAGSDTLSSAGDTLTTGTFTSSKFNQVMTHKIPSGATQTDIQLGNTTIDSGNNYSYRWSEDGGSDQTTTGTSKIAHDVFFNSTIDTFMINYIVNISSEEKLAISFHVGETSGSGTPPHRSELVGKWANTSNQFDIVNGTNTSGGSFNTDTNLTVLGSDAVASATVQDGAIFEETDTNKHYLLDDGTWTEI